MLLGMSSIVGNCFRNAVALATRACSFLTFFASAGAAVELLGTFFEIGATAVPLDSFLDFLDFALEEG